MVANVKDNSTEVNDSIQVIASLSQLILSKTIEVNTLANETLNAAQMNNISSETQLSSIQEITAASESLASLSEEMQTVIQHFKL